MVLLPLLVLFAVSFETNRDIVRSPILGNSFPEFELVDLHSGTLRTLEDFPSGAKLVNVWGSWCAACAVEHPLMMDKARDGIPIIGLNYKDDPESAKEWLDVRGDSYIFSIADRNGDFGIDLGVTGAPTTFILDDQNVVMLILIGALTEERWNLSVQPLIGSSNQGRPSA